MPKPDNSTDGQPGITTVSGGTRPSIPRAVAATAVVMLVVVGAYFVPLPSVSHLRDWASAVGPGFFAVFFLAYTIITVAPVPRTPFTVASGLLFGPLVGFVGAMIATVVAACLAFGLVRRYGRDRVSKHLSHPVAARIDARLARRGWLAVGSLRIIAACPFSVANYSCALSAVPFRQYLAATVIGVAPGTASVVIIGDALTGTAHPVMIALSVCLFALGVGGLFLDDYLDRRATADCPTPDAQNPVEPLRGRR